LRRRTASAVPWITHRYPGIRSDSDLYTFGYRFKPWTGAPIATAAEILSYMSEVIDENDLGRHVRYRHEITSASWSSRENLWMLEATRTDTGESLRFAGNFLWICQGYYRHSHGYTPEWSGIADHRGQLVHPQNWPEDLDCAGKNVVVIGSGSTAATLIPAIAPECGHVTMLQRSPTYFRTGRNAIAIADELRELDIDEAWIHEIVRKKILHDQAVFTGRSFTEPEVVKQELLAGVRAYLGPAYDIEAHFTSEIPAVAAAHRLHSRWRFLRGDPRRQSIGRHRRNREVHASRYSPPVGQDTGGRHHRHRHGLQSQCAR
jgi:cation diffusion facilitator CzcD-associated flavoprotein CzcO